MPSYHLVNLDELRIPVSFSVVHKGMCYELELLLSGDAEFCSGDLNGVPHTGEEFKAALPQIVRQAIGEFIQDQFPEWLADALSDLAADEEPTQRPEGPLH